MNNQELESRLIDFSLAVIEISSKIDNSTFGVYLNQQLTRSALSPALNYGEAQAAESKKDFIHKIRICLKELRETYVSLRILHRTNEKVNNKKLEMAIQECNELISIFVVSIKTTQKQLNI